MRRNVLWNSLANLGGTLLGPLLAVALVPFYVRQLGLEGYGLIGFFAMLLALLGVVTKGIGIAVQKEVAVRRLDERAPSIGSLLRTYEIVYWAIGVTLAVILATATPWIARAWLGSASLPMRTIEICLALIAARIALTLPISVYQSVHFGAERQVRSNSVSSVFVLLGAAATVIVVASTKSLIGFYAADLAVAFAGVIAMRWSAKTVVRAVAPDARFHFSKVDIVSSWRFSATVLWSHGLALLITQTDRLAVSALLPLAALGVFTAASAGGRLLGTISGPYLNAIFPEMCRLAAPADRTRLLDALVGHARIAGGVILALGVPLAVFAPEALFVWTRNPVIARDGAIVLVIYAAANILLAFASVLYQAQVALDAPRYGSWFGTAGIFWMPPLAYFLTKEYGLAGAATSWLVYCGLSWVWNVGVMFLLLTRSAAHLRTYLWDAAVVALPAIAVALLLRAVFAGPIARQPALAVPAAAAAAAVTFAIAYVQSFGFRLPRAHAARTGGQS